MYGGFDVNSFCDNLDDGYGVFDDVADSLNFAAVGIDASEPVELLGEGKNIAESNKKNNNKTSRLVNKSPKGAKGRRGRKPGQKPTCSNCQVKGHTKRKCPTPTAHVLAAKRLGL